MAESEQYDDKPKETAEGNAREKYVRFWLQSIEAQRKDDRDWLKNATEAVRIYRSDTKGADTTRHVEFNIFHANVETTLPAIYNSVPVPDVRRRFGDKDKVAKTVSQMLERCLSFSVDNYDFSETMRQVLFDGLVPGRGVARVRYVPYFTEMGEQEAAEPPDSVANEAPPEPQQQLSYEEVSCEYVPYTKFIVGPGDTWEDVPWLAFEHLLKREQIEKLVGKAKAKKVQLDFNIDGTEDISDNDNEADQFKRARVYEIWDKEERKVRFIATGYTTEPLYEEDDPLGLDGFFPAPRPVQPIMTPGNLVPVCPYEIYKSLVEELGEITFRIKRLVKQLRVRGGTAGGETDLEKVSAADDGQLVPIEGIEAFLSTGNDINKMIAWWPLEPTVKALAQLYQQREQVKQTIYEVTGISDIVRGASKASETATAQEIKNQWGSLRIQKMQGDVQRFARDIFRLKAEIIAKKFAPETCMMISGITLLPGQQKQMIQQQLQAAQQPPMPGQPPAPPPQIPDEIKRALEEPSLEEVFGVMQSDVMRSYKIDIESDSTIRSDLTRNQRQMNEFLQGSAQFVAAVGPAVQTGQMPGNVAAEVYTAFARNYKLGKQAEDALDKMAENASKPQPPKPDPEAEKAKMQMQIEQQKMAHQTQLEQAKMQLEQVKAQQQAALEQQKMELEREKAAQELELKRQIAMLEMQIKQETTAAELQLKGQEAEVRNQQAGFAMEKDHELKRMQLNSTHELGRAKIASDGMLNAKKIRTMDGEDPADAETPDSFDQMAQAITELAQAVIQSNEKQVQSNELIMRAISAPKVGKRNPDGSMTMQTVIQ